MACQSDVAVHGRKRPAEGELDDRPLTKRFGRLQIGPLASLNLPEFREEQAQRVPTLHRQSDAMLLDDTDTTLYIHDLEKELAEAEAVDGALTVLPGLEDRLSITNILVANNSKHPCTEIVLYREPESLSIPKDKDQVRRALMETRERVRLSQQRLRSSSTQRRKDKLCTDQDFTQKEECQRRVNWDDVDAMDIDADMDIDTDGPWSCSKDGEQ
ncbi:hypothetical protein BDW66DRAFT_32692 [Aspergillus desertorum]